MASAGETFHRRDGPVRVLIVDEHPILREGLRAILERSPDLAVVGEATSAEEAMTRLQSQGVDVVLTELSMKGQGGLWLIERLRREFPQVQAVVLSAKSDDESVLEAFQAGANGYLAKSSSGAQIVAAIEAVGNGQTYLQPNLADVFIRLLRTGLRKKGDALTARELSTLELLAQGYKNNQIAEQQILSISTVKSHLRTLFAKLEVSGRSEAVLEGLRRGLISPTRRARPTPLLD